MKPRKLELGNKNIIGARITETHLVPGMTQVEPLAKLQLTGIIMSLPLFHLESQKRPVSDKETTILANALSVSVDWLG